MTEEFQQIQSQINEAFSFQQEINLYKRGLERKLKSINKTENISKEEDINLQLISKDTTYIEKLKKTHKNLVLFENKAKKDIIVKRTHVPQEYAGLSSYKTDQNQYLVATANMMPCVGVAFYCKYSKAGMVIHFDHSQNDLAEIEKYFSKLFNLITQDATTKNVNITIVLSDYDHQGLDSNVQTAVDNFKKFLQEQGIEVSADQKETHTTIACLVLNLANGAISTNYEENELAVNQPLGQVLNIPTEGGELYHLRRGEIYLQPKDALYQTVTNEEKDTPFAIPKNCMIPQDSVAQRAIIAHNAQQNFSQTSSYTTSDAVNSSGAAILSFDVPAKSIELEASEENPSRLVENKKGDIRSQLKPS